MESCVRKLDPLDRIFWHSSFVKGCELFAWYCPSVLFVFKNFFDKQFFVCVNSTVVLFYHCLNVVYLREKTHLTCFPLVSNGHEGYQTLGAQTNCNRKILVALNPLFISQELQMK